MKILRSHSLSALLIVMVFAFSFNYAIAKDLAQYQEHIQQLKRGNPTLTVPIVKQIVSDFVNGGFETGDFSGWSFGDNGLSPLWPWDVCPALSCGWFMNNEPIEGKYDALNGFDGAAGYEAFLYQDVQVPDGGGKVSLWDRIQYDSLGIPSSLPRIYEVQIRDTSDNILEVPIHVEVLLNGAAYTDLGWQNRVIDVSKYAGKKIRVYIWLFVPEDFTGPAQIEFDYFALNSGTINGKVKDNMTGAPIEGALVIALQGPTRLKTKTNEDGFYEIKGLLPGSWRVLCWKKGYKFALKIVTLDPGESKAVDFMLVPKVSSNDDEIPPEFREAVNGAPALSPRHKFTTTWGAIKKR